jgi:hypothetical protein
MSEDSALAELPLARLEHQISADARSTSVAPRASEVAE